MMTKSLGRGGWVSRLSPRFRGMDNLVKWHVCPQWPQIDRLTANNIWKIVTLYDPDRADHLLKIMQKAVNA